MVHALKQVHRILRPNGLLVNIQPLPSPHSIEVHSVETVTKVGWLTDQTDFASERSSFNALAQVVAEGYFMLEDEQEFNFNVYGVNLNEFQEWLAEWWGSAIFPQRTIQRVEEIYQEADHSTRVVLIDPVRMTKLRAVWLE